MDNYEVKINELKEKLEKAKGLKIRAEAKLEQLQKQREELINELNRLGVKPENLDLEIDSLNKDIKELINKVEELLPKDI